MWQTEIQSTLESVKYLYVCMYIYVYILYIYHLNMLICWFSRNSRNLFFMQCYIPMLLEGKSISNGDQNQSGSHIWDTGALLPDEWPYV